MAKTKPRPAFLQDLEDEGLLSLVEAQQTERRPVGFTEWTSATVDAWWRIPLVAYEQAEAILTYREMSKGTGKSRTVTGHTLRVYARPGHSSDLEPFVLLRGREHWKELVDFDEAKRIFRACVAFLGGPDAPLEPYFYVGLPELAEHVSVPFELLLSLDRLSAEHPDLRIVSSLEDKEHRHQFLSLQSPSLVRAPDVDGATKRMSPTTGVHLYVFQGLGK